MAYSKHDSGTSIYVIEAGKRIQFDTVSKTMNIISTTIDLSTISTHPIQNKQISANSKYNLEQWTSEAFQEGFNSTSNKRYYDAIYSEFGSYVVSISEVNQIEIWNSASKTSVQTFYPVSYPIVDLDENDGILAGVSIDGSLFVFFSDNLIIPLWLIIVIAGVVLVVIMVAVVVYMKKKKQK